MNWTPVIAMLCIAGLEALAITQNVDGAVLGIVVAALAGLGGYELKSYREKRKEGKRYAKR